MADITVVVPFLDAIGYLRETAPTIVDAARHHGVVEVIYVDNGSRDGSTEFLTALAPDIVRVVPCEGATISAMRNTGARAGNGTFLSFLDADCAIAPGYFEAAVLAIASSHADATGCEYALPPHPHWVERTLHALHYVARERDVQSINAGNFFIARRAFDDVAGFREDIATDEDADICRRLVLSGHRIRENPAVSARHLGNPKSLRAHYRRTVWHALGMFANVTARRMDKPTAMMLLHTALSVVGVLALFVSAVGLRMRLATAIVLQFVVPAITVAFRARQTHRIPPLPASLALYWVYYWARVHALILILLGRKDAYRK